MSNKDTLLSVGEIAKKLGLTRRIILNYEDHGLIHADTRGESNTGYRYYSMDTLARIRTIRTYQKIGLSLEEIKHYFDESTNLTPVLNRLEALREELDANITMLRERMKQHKQEDIFTTILPAYTVYAKTSKDATIELRTAHLREIAYAAITKHGTDTSKRMYFTEFNASDPDAITYCAAVPQGSQGDSIQTLESVKAIAKYHYGSYTKLSEAHRALLAYVQEHQLKLSGRCRHIYLEGPPQHKDSNNFITMVALILTE